MKNTINEKKAASKAQQKFMGMVHAVQKGELDPGEVGPSVRKAAKSMPKKAAKEMASTKHKKLPNHVDENMKITQQDIQYVINEAVRLVNERYGYSHFSFGRNIDVWDIFEDIDESTVPGLYEAIKEEGIPVPKADMEDEYDTVVAFVEQVYDEYLEMSKIVEKKPSKYVKNSIDATIYVELEGEYSYDPGDYWTPPYEDSDIDYDSINKEVTAFSNDIAPLKSKGKAYEMLVDYLEKRFEDILINIEYDKDDIRGNDYDDDAYDRWKDDQLM